MNPWVLIYRVGWVALGILLLAAVTALFLPDIKEYRELRRKQQVLSEDLRLEEEMVAHLKKQQEKLQSDPRFIEKIAREEFGLAKQGETVFKFTDEDTSTSTNRLPRRKRTP